LIYRDKPWEQVGDTYKSAASPAMDRDGNVFFADPAGNRIYRSDATRIVTVFKENTGGARALRFGADGRLYATQLSARRLVSYGPAGDELVVAQNIQAGIAFGGPGRAWLYVAQGNKLFRRETRRTGVVAWEPIKPPQPGL
jgi:outer membrane protein assembly factor BamB